MSESLEQTMIKSTQEATTGWGTPGRPKKQPAPVAPPVEEKPFVYYAEIHTIEETGGWQRYICLDGERVHGPLMQAELEELIS